MPPLHGLWAAKNTEENPAASWRLIYGSKMLADHLASAPVPRRVLDLGCGHGVIAARVLQEIEGTTLVGVDGSAPMLDLALEHLASTQTGGPQARLTSRWWPQPTWRVDHSRQPLRAQSLHNCTYAGKHKALASVRAVLAPAGLFLLVDRIRLATPGPFGMYQSVWDLLGPTSYNHHLEGRAFEEHEQTRIARGDQPGSLEQNPLWLPFRTRRSLAAKAPPRSMPICAWCDSSWIGLLPAQGTLPIFTWHS